MKNVIRFRAMASLCRQQAVYNPARNSRLLAEARYWEHLAAAEMAFHFKECNTNSSSDLAKSGTTPDANDTRWKAIVAA